ncbi:Wadjet anti-phage system protein JetD domain-containing protein [Mycolicibacterium porcinum]|uniref:Wadjet anti-phage system protein JetD domain-containing protein n=1 Tax=Mycolicibacterium porcinum TaxID=39693 RepID=UPI001648EB36|nr:Wadjet anti-phage system protein JetD domain-containing protein [Mycolicibacterium porcinum]
MKTPDEVAASAAAKLKRCWAHSLIEPNGGEWPQHWTILATAATNKSVAAIAAPRLVELTRRWHAAAAEHPGLTFDEQTWNVHGGQTLPQKVRIADIDTAAALAAERDCPLGDWPTLLKLARARHAQLREVNPGLPASQMESLLRATIGYSDTDFTLLCTVATWFAANEAAALGMTPRQVPLPGVHAKWLNTHQNHVTTLAGCADGLRLLPNHAPRIHFTYLDPHYRSTGGRAHDSHTLGDPMTLPYQPHMIIISENKDTAILFPPTPGAVAIEGGGYEGAKKMHQFNWIADCPNMVYWGDLDAAGFAIVNTYRATLPVSTILMDYSTYLRYAEFGTNHYPDGRLIPTGGPALPNLSDDEAMAYAAVTDLHADPRRIEQERIPLPVAAQALAPFRAH